MTLAAFPELVRACNACPGAPVLVIDGTEYSPVDAEIVLVARLKGRRVLVACVPQGNALAVAAELGAARARVLARGEGAS